MLIGVFPRASIQRPHRHSTAISRHGSDSKAGICVEGNRTCVLSGLRDWILGNM
jgi:hypothetical protein